MTNKHDHNPGNPAGGKGGPANDNGGAATLPWANARPFPRAPSRARREPPCAGVRRGYRQKSRNRAGLNSE